jgi:hypothetical protein
MFLTLALDGGEGPHVSDALPLKERSPSICWIGGWVGLRPNLDAVV